MERKGLKVSWELLIKFTECSARANICNRSVSLHDITSVLIFRWWWWFFLPHFLFFFFINYSRKTCFTLLPHLALKSVLRLLGKSQLADKHLANRHLTDKHFDKRLWLTDIWLVSIWTRDFDWQTFGSQTINQHTFGW